MPSTSTTTDTTINAAAVSIGVPTANNSDYQDEFYNTGRIGRRNALPDILGYNQCTTTTADLPERLAGLTTNDKDDNHQSGTSLSYINRNQPSTSQQACINNQTTTTTATGSSNNAINNT